MSPTEHPTAAIARSIEIVTGVALCLLLFLNVVDGVLTVFWVQHGYATEANVLLADLLNHVAHFSFVKLALCTLGASILWRLRRSLLARVGTFAVCAAYCAVVVHHLSFAAQLYLPSAPVETRIALVVTE